MKSGGDSCAARGAPAPAPAGRGSGSSFASAALVVTSLLLALLSPASTLAQEQPAGFVVTSPLVEARRQEVESMADIDDALRKQLAGIYGETLAFLNAERSAAAAAASFARLRETAPAEIERLREELEHEMPVAKDSPDLPKGAGSREIEQRIQQLAADKAARAARQASIEQKLNAEADRPGLARQRTVAATAKIEEVSSELDAPAPDEPPLLVEARRWIQKSHLAALNAELRSLEEEQLSRPARLELLKLQRDDESRKLKRIQAQLVLLDAALAEARRVEAEKVVAEADDAAQEQEIEHPLIDELVASNRVLGQELKDLTASLEKVELAQSEAQALMKAINDDFQIARQRLEIAGLSQALGQILHEQRRDLPALRQYQRRARQREETIAAVGLREILLESERRDLQSRTRYVGALVAELPETEREPLIEPLRNIAASRRTLLEETAAVNGKYLRALGELDFVERQLIAAAQEFDQFLAERLLWIRSKKGIGLQSLVALPGEVARFFSPGPFLDALDLLAERFPRSPVLILASLISLPVLLRSRKLRDAARATGSLVGRPARDSFVFTLQGLGYALLLCLPWPLLATAVGYELSASLDSSEQVKAMGLALVALAPALFYLRSFRALCIKGGVAEAHFRWPSQGVTRMRRQLDQLLITFVLPAYVLIDAFNRDPGDFGGELGRISFIVATTGVAAFLVRLLQPETGIIEEIRRNQFEAPKRLNWIWLLLAAVIPGSFIVAALAGYLYSATTLMGRLINTIWLAWGIVLVHELVSRWLLLVKRRMMLKAALERRDAAQQARAQESEPSRMEEVPSVAEEHEPEVDIALIDSDTRKLMNMGLLVLGLVMLSGIWSSVLPALAVFRDITLWEHLAGAPGEEALSPVTLADFGLALLYTFVAYMSARSLPSLLDVALRHRTGLDAGSRLAYSTLLRYAIVLIAVAAVTNTIGFDWNKLQWLVAALGVGIGFGLQEIVANFISGLIILVERPIRVGDIVTVGDVSGVVSRLQIRATTVTNWDRQELLVPNKEFITGRVLNWSLSDEVIRIVVNVGVQYGTDMHLALRLIEEAVNGHPRILQDPKPLITFDQFGDNALVINARAFIGSLANRREITSELHLAVLDALAGEGIVVAFPQRDVHLDASSPIPVQIHREPSDEEPA